MSKNIREMSDEEILGELMRRHEPARGPSNIIYSTPTVVMTLQIGPDFHADVIMWKDAQTELQRILAAEQVVNPPEQIGD